RRGPSLEQARPRVGESARARRTVRPARRRALRDDRERQRLRQREPARWLAEIDEARGADALDVTAVGNEVEISLEDLAIRVPALDLERARDLLELAAKRA